jgi:hypothetical protein
MNSKQNDDPKPASFWRALTGHTTQWKVAQFSQAQAEWCFRFVPRYCSLSTRIQLKGPPRRTPIMLPSSEPAKPRLTAVPIDVLPLQIATTIAQTAATTTQRTGPTKYEVTGRHWALREVNFHLFFDRFGAPGFQQCRPSALTSRPCGNDEF